MTASERASVRRDDGLPCRLPVAAVATGLAAAVVTAGAVSWATPDGNLVVTSVPALIAGLAAFGLASWRSRRRGRLRNQKGGQHA